MRSMFINILSLLRHLAFIAVVYGMFIQPVAETFVFFSQAHYELADLDGAEETNKEEKQEEDREDNKIDLQNVSVYEYHLAYFEKSSHYGEHGRMWDFTPEIPITPPEQV
jgi:hypothetical protein